MKIIKNNLHRVLIILMIMSTLLSACQSREGDDTSAQTEAHGHDDEETGVITLTHVQMASAEIRYGQIDTLSASGTVKTNGILDLPPRNIANISAPLPGFVKKANHLVGDYVKKGSVLVVMEHPDYIKLQENYMTLSSRLEYLKAEWQRQQKLDSASVGARKRYQEAESEYKVALGKVQSLEQQLIYLGFNPDRVDEGKFSSTLYIRAPFNGYITQLNTHNGMFVQPETALYEMIDPSHMHLELDVFEKDIPKVEIGQRINFTVPALGKQRYKGEVYLIGRSFNMEKKTIKVHGHINDDPMQFIRGLYLVATIYTGSAKVAALPEEAIVRDDGKEYIFVSSSQGHTDDPADHQDEETVEFQRIEITTGMIDNGMAEITRISSLPANARIVIQGAYDIYSEMKKGEGEHHHH